MATEKEREEAKNNEWFIGVKDDFSSPEFRVNGKFIATLKHLKEWIALYERT
jgi:hypothetical protein